MALVAVLLAVLVWLAGRYEMARQQQHLDDDAAQVASDVRLGLGRNLQGLQALTFGPPGSALGPAPGWSGGAAELLRQRRELLRIEWRDLALKPLGAADSPYRPPVFLAAGREALRLEIEQACAGARRLAGAAYNSSYFVPLPGGVGVEVMDVCVPVVDHGRPTGYLLATYSLPGVLAELPPTTPLRARRVSFTEADGSRLAVFGQPVTHGRAYNAQQLLDLPGGATLVVRLDAWRGAPALFPNVLTAVVAALAAALLIVLALLGRDMRKRQSAEGALAEALAFRKAMEDSLVTGLRARDLKGRITYVNPAFCAMTGFDAVELIGSRAADAAPYWPTERIAEYRQRQATRMAGELPPPEGYESQFMRKDGTRFPVLIIEAPLIDARGLRTGWMSACVDLTEQRRSEDLARATGERLQATARLATVGEMASLLSHELNQPLAAISSYATGGANLLAEGAGAPPGDGPPAAFAAQSALLAHALGRIGEQAERAGRVIRSVQDFVRRSEPSRVAVRPAALIDAVMPLVLLHARKLGVQVVVDVAQPEPPAVLCDATLIEQVLLNLARNGMQAMEPLAPGTPRRLTLSVARAGGAARVDFAVADLGAGIADEVAEQLYTPFFTTKSDGMGLGLSLCRTVVEQHGGQLVHGANAPRGTIFRFSLAVAGT